MDSRFSNLVRKLSSAQEFNQEKLRQLCEDTDSETVFKILSRFNETLKESLALLEEAISNNRQETIWKVAHKISGSAELLGFVEFGIRARNLSHHLRENPNSRLYDKDISQFFLVTKKIHENINSSLV